MKNRKINTHIKYTHIFYLFLGLTVNLFGMERKTEQLDYTLCFELLLRRFIHIDYHITGALFLVNKRLNKIVHTITEQGKSYLSSYVVTQPSLIRIPDYYKAFYALGNACAFLTITNTNPKNTDKYDLNLCRLQLSDDKVSVYTHRIMGIIRWFSGKKAKQYSACNLVKDNEYVQYLTIVSGYKRNTHTWYPKEIEGPSFDSDGNIHITVHSLNYSHKRDNFRKKSFIVDEKGELQLDHSYRYHFVFRNNNTLRLCKNSHSNF